MSATAVPVTGFEAGKTILDTLIKKSRKACYVDWIVGTVFAYIYVGSTFAGQTTLPDVLEKCTMWPIVALFAISRGCDTLKAFARAL